MMSGCFQNAFQISGSILAAVIAAGQLCLRNRNSVNYFYAATFISIAAWSGINSIMDISSTGGYTAVWGFLNAVSWTSYSVTAVLFYFLMQSIFNQSFRVQGVMYAFFIPALITFTSLNLSYFLYKSSYIYVNQAAGLFLYLFSISIYVLILYQVNGLRRNSGTSSRIALLKIMVFLAVAAILTIIPQLAYRGFSDSYSVTILTILFYIATMRYPESFILLRNEAQKAQYAKSKVSRLDVEHLKSEIERLMQSDRVFLNSDLTLNELASEIGITPHQLSEILNVYYRRNFYDFINFYRIEEAKRIFLEDVNATALGICFKVGFNSNSAFYRAFKKETGTSPARYRKTR